MTTRNQKGFTLIELIVVIAVLGILAGVAIPRFINVTQQAQVAAARADIGAVKAGVLNFAAQNAATTGKLTYPPTLGAATQNRVFVDVLDPMSAADMFERGWTQNADGKGGTFGASGISFVYDPATGIVTTTLPAIP